MNKLELIRIEIEKNKQEFGRWHSDRRPGSSEPIKLLFEKPPTDELESLQHGNALAKTGNYPVGTSECFNVGISGGCGPDCFVYLKGKCSEPQEMIERLDGDEELQRHADLYGVSLGKESGQ